MEKVHYGAGLGCAKEEHAWDHGLCWRNAIVVHELQSLDTPWSVRCERPSLLLVAMPFAPSSVLVPSSKARSP